MQTFIGLKPHRCPIVTFSGHDVDITYCIAGKISEKNIRRSVLFKALVNIVLVVGWLRS